MIDRTEYKNYSSTFLTKMNLSVFVVRHLNHMEMQGSSLILHCDAVKCDKTAVGSSALMVSRYFVNTGDVCEVTVRVDFIDDGVVRIRLQKGGETEQIQHIMIVKEPTCVQSVSIEDAADKIAVVHGALVINIRKRPFHISICDKDGKTLYSQYNDDLHSTINDRRRGLNEAKDEMELEIIKSSYPAFETYPFGFVQDNETGEICYTEAICMTYDESFFGLGESFSRCDKNGEEKYIWTINPIGVSTSKSYKVVPFFMSSEGYGLYLNSPRKNIFDMGSYFFKAYSVSVFDNQIDLFFIYGPGYADILKRYTGITGKCLNVPPKWSFGSWIGRNCYRSRKEMEEIAVELRRRRLPCDVLHLDWDYTRKETEGFDYRFDEERFPDPVGMMSALKKHGFHVSIWQLPYVRKNTPIFNFALEKGYLSSPPPGKTRELDDNGVIDLSNPEARAWYQEKIRDLLNLGIAVIKTDFGENADETYIYHSISGADMHNLYPLLYNIAAYEICEEVCGDDALVWGRSAYAGNQRFPLYWGGDSDSDYLGLFHSLRGGLSLGLSGFSFWSYDVGGYFGRPDPDVYIRWLELGMLSSHIRFHGTTEREPWHYGEVAVEIYRKYAELRYSLIEYLYTEAHTAVEESLPLMRHLVIDFGDDPTVRTIDDQFLLGRSIMVAGVFDKKNTRKLYLPKGRWMDWHTGEVLDGNRWITRDVPIDILPIYMRSGSVIPMVEPKQYTDEKVDDYVIWKIFADTNKICSEVKGFKRPVSLCVYTSDGQLVVDITDPLNLSHILEIHGITAFKTVGGAKASKLYSEMSMLRISVAEGIKTVTVKF